MKNSILFIILFLSVHIIAQNTGFQQVTQSAQLQHLYQSPGVMGGGVAAFDYNNDHLEDIFLTGGDLPDQLFRNNGDGTFSNVTEAAGIPFPFSRTTGVITGDLNNNGFRDIILTTVEEHTLLYQNNGDGTFTDITWDSGIYSAWDNGTDEGRGFSASLGDINLDGFLDVYVCNWVESGSFITDPVTNEVVGFSYHGASNRLYLNNGDMTFTEVCDEYDAIEMGCSLASVFSDYDNDRDMDILVANDFGLWDRPDALYTNDFPNEAFIDQSESSGFNTKLYGMGIGVGDYDRDGDLDYYKTSIGAAAFMQNQGDGTFQEVAESAGIDDTYVQGEAPYLSVHWGAGFADFDHDGWLDLAVAKGRVGFPNLFPSLDSMPDQLWRNRGDGTFEDISDWFDLPNYQLARGLAFIDYDNDGDIDLLFANSDSTFQNTQGAGSPVLYQNILSEGGNWLKVKTQGTVNNRDGLGTHLTIHVNGVSWLHEIGSGGQGHSSQHSSVAHFGLGAATEIDSLVVSWPGNLTPLQVFYDIPANHYIKIIEGTDDWEIINSLPVAVHDLEESPIRTSLFPNPNRGEFNYSIENPLRAPLSISLYHSNGHMIWKSELINDAASWQKEFHLQQNGIFFMRVQVGKQITYERIVVLE